jgi:isocitrate dehydrogenase (NAD+)
MAESSASSLRRQTVTLIRGDGIGPEITAAVQEILDAAAVPIEWEEREAGLECAQRWGTPLPAETLASILRNRVALKGPTTTPIGSGHKSVNVTIRKALDLFANVRPARSLPGVRTRFENVDLIVLRENIEDTYGGIEHWQTPDVVQQLRIITRPGSEVFIRFAFELARRQGRRRITCVHKANIHKMSDGLFRELFYRIAAEYPELHADDILIDNLCMQLVVNPERFDVLVLPNLFGDLVSDLCAGLVGGLGVAPGGNIGTGRAVFEAVHGSAPDIAGRGIANPTALLLSAVQMLHFLGLHRHAHRIEEAVRLTLASGHPHTRPRRQCHHAGVHPRGDQQPCAAGFHRAAHAAGGSPAWSTAGCLARIRPLAPPRYGCLRALARGLADAATAARSAAAPDDLQPRHTRLSRRAPAHPAGGLVPLPLPLPDPITPEQLLQALQELTATGVRWMHVELLHHVNGTALYSRAQGEE